MRRKGLAAEIPVAYRKGEEPGMRVRRLVDGPIISPDLHPSIGRNIQGPSLIRAPDWIEGRRGDYYLYFADHKGRYIRLAYADQLAGPWTIYPPGSLQLEQSGFLTEPPKVTPEQFALPRGPVEAERRRNVPRSARGGHDPAHRLAGCAYRFSRTADRHVFPRPRRCRDAGHACRQIAQRHRLRRAARDSRALLHARLQA